MTNALPKYLRNARYVQKTRLEELASLKGKLAQLERKARIAKAHGQDAKAKHILAIIQSTQAIILLVADGLDMTKDQHRHISRTRQPKLKASGSWDHGQSKANYRSVG